MYDLLSVCHCKSSISFELLDVENIVTLKSRLWVYLHLVSPIHNQPEKKAT